MLDSTPAVRLTPDFTDSGEGEGSSSPASETATKSRRLTAFYPNMNASNKPVKPFSRSAAKRQSVMTLGSIEHLQHYFTKTGIAAKSNPSKKLNGQLVPAIGGIASLKTSKPSLGSIVDFELPPSPAVPEIRQPTFPSTKTYQTDPEAFLPGVVQDLTAVTQAWDISCARPDPNCLAPTSRVIDVLEILKTTTRAVRSVRNYVIALPDESAGTLRTQYRNKVAASTLVPKRNPPQSKPQLDPLSLIRKSALEVLASLRELEERSRIPLSDEAYDAQSDRGSSQHLHSRGTSPAPISDDDSDLPQLDPDMSISFVRVQGRSESVPVWEDENDLDAQEEREKREHWDDRLVLGGGWLYKQDVKLGDLVKEQDVVKRYVDLVDDVLFGGTKDVKRGWEREVERNAKRAKEGRGQNRRVSTGDMFTYRFPAEASRSGRRVVSTSSTSSGLLDSMCDMSLLEEPKDMATLSEAESVDEDELPDWAKRTLFADDPVGRAHALLVALLPEDLRSLVPSPAPKSAFLSELTSGQCLCAAYNTGVRRSRKPWGFISVDSVHDIAALEQSANGADGDEKSKVGWTFRRIDNLRLWAGALKLRYLLPLVLPSALGRPDHLPRTASPARAHPRGVSPARSPSSHTTTFPDAPPSPSARIRSATAEPPLNFDPRLVARKDEGWEVMLETVLLRWVVAVVEETRSESPR